MALPKDVKFVTFDCYGTLIDWESGVYDAFQKEADRDGFTIDRDALIPRFIEIQREIQRGSYELYAEVLRRTAIAVARRSVCGPCRCAGRIAVSRATAATGCTSCADLRTVGCHAVLVARARHRYPATGPNVPAL